MFDFSPGPGTEGAITPSLLFEGNPIDAYGYAVQMSNELHLISIADSDLSKRVSTYRIADLPEWLGELRLLTDINWPGHFSSIRVYIQRSWKQEEIRIVLAFYFDLDDWKNLWSIAEYGEAFGRNMQLQGIPDTHWEQEGEWISSGFLVHCPPAKLETSIELEVSTWLERVRVIHDETVMMLASQVRSESIVMFFDFPQEVRVPCEQYLIYFTQFLKDLGVDASSDIQHEAGRVLFAVTPDDPNQALDIIRRALEIYLQLPSNPDVDLSPDFNADIKVQQLAANIHHFKGQLALASAMLQAKDATIELKNATIQEQHFTIYRLSRQQLLSGEVLVTSLKYIDDHTKDQDEEPILGGMAAITPYEGTGFKINLPEIMRRLKRMFSNQEDED